MLISIAYLFSPFTENYIKISAVIRHCSFTLSLLMNNTPISSSLCSHNSSYIASVEFLETGCHVGSIFMITLSSYSLFLIAKKSPTSMKSSVPYMINLHVWTMFCDSTWAVLVLPMFFMPVIAAHSSGILLLITENQSVLLWLSFASLGGSKPFFYFH